MNRRTLLKAGAVALAGATAGCSGSDDQPDLDIKDLSAEITDIPTIHITMLVSNEGDGVGYPMGTIKLEHEGELIAKKKQKMTAIPKSKNGIKGTFKFIDFDLDGTYTVSGTIPGHDWVTVDKNPD